MTQQSSGNVSSILGSIAVVLLATCCAGADEAGTDETDLPGDVATQSDELSRWHRRFGHRPVPRPGGATGGTSASGGSTSNGGATSSGGTSSGGAACEVCAKANACCNAVSGGPLCTFSEATCASLPKSSQDPYINSCKVLLNTVASVRSTLPNSCR